MRRAPFRRFGAKLLLGVAAFVSAVTLLAARLSAQSTAQLHGMLLTRESATLAVLLTYIFSQFYSLGAASRKDKAADGGAGTDGQSGTLRDLLRGRDGQKGRWLMRRFTEGAGASNSSSPAAEGGGDVTSVGQALADAAEQRRADESRRQRRQLEALWAMARLNGADHKSLCHRVLTEVLAMTGSAQGYFGVLEGDVRLTTLHAVSRENPEGSVRGKGSAEFRGAQALFAKAASGKGSLILNDLRAHAEEVKYFAWEGAPGTRALVVPIVTHERVAACVVVGDKPSDYTPGEAAEISAFVTNALVILDRTQAEDALRESEQKLRDLFENASDIIYTTDLKGNFTSFNRAAERATGYTKEEVTKLNVTQLVAAEDLELVQQMVRAELGGQGRMIFEAAVLTKDGRRLFVEVNSRLQFKDGAPTGIQGIARDVTERKRAAALERDCRHALEMVAQHQPLPRVLAHLAGMVENQFHNACVSLSLLEENCLRVAAAPSLPKGFLSRMDGLPLGPGAASTGAAAFWKRPVLVNDIASDNLWDEYREAALSHGLCSSFAVPLLSGKGQVLGALELLFREMHSVASPELSLLDTAARLAAIAIEHSELAERLAYQAQHDPLTGLSNRLVFEDRLAHSISHAKRSGRLVSLMYLDLDRFKLINDTLGHPAGDRLLQQVASRLKNCVRESDTLARTGGDEFTAILEEVDSPEHALAVAQRFAEVLRRPFHVGSDELFITASIGLSLYPRDGADATTLQRNADSAMYAAKNSGRNRVQHFTAEMNERIQKRLELENDLHWALERGQLSLHYQPQFEIATGKLAGFEALLRWEHPRVGQVPPSTFIPIAEESGLIGPISDWVLHEACRQSLRWRHQGHPPVKVVVNISASQFGRIDLAETVTRVLSVYGLEPWFLGLELTESLIMRDVEESARQMEKLQELGVGISIDDFGTGYSSLSYLHSLPIDSLKIDQSFVHNMGSSEDMVRLVQSIVSLGHSLGVSATAEGVETEWQLEALQKMGCDKAQGFLLGRPLPPGEAERFFRDGNVPPQGPQAPLSELSPQYLS